MNKDLLISLPADEQPAASKLSSIIDDLQLSASFQSELEAKLLDAAQKKIKPARVWHTKILPAVAWTAAAIGAVLILNWTIRSMASPAPVATSEPMPSFEESVHQGKICAGPLALGHGFAVSLTNADKTGFVPLDPEKSIGELRSFAWSHDGSQLAILGNTPGGGNVWLTDPAGSPLRPALSNSELGYLMDVAWSRDGKQFVLWSSQNNKVVYLLSTDGSSLLEKQLDVFILGTPLFTPDETSIVFYGSDATSSGLFKLILGNSSLSLVNPSVEDSGGYAFSPDGSHLAYMEYDRDAGEARLISEDLAARQIAVLGTLPIPKGSGSSIPETANLSWSADGRFLVFDFGQYASKRDIYLAPVEGSGLIKLADLGYSPSISADGRCLAYIKDNKVFLLDLNNISPNSTTETPLIVGDLPIGRGNPNFKQDKLQWRP